MLSQKRINRIEKKVKLTVRFDGLTCDDATKHIVHLSKHDMKSLGWSDGDIVRITQHGRRNATAIATCVSQNQLDRNTIAADPLLLLLSGLTPDEGTFIFVQKISKDKVSVAKEITLIPELRLHETERIPAPRQLRRDSEGMPIIIGSFLKYWVTFDEIKKYRFGRALFVIDLRLESNKAQVGIIGKDTKIVIAPPEH